jgi:very-short-patch-repair endonuclease
MELERRAERQDGVIAGRDARAAGLSKHQVYRRRAAGRWRAVRRDVMVVVGAPPSWRQLVRATVIAAGEGIVASHSTTARLLGVPVDDADEYAVIEVLGPLGRGVRLDGVIGHRSRRLPPIDVTSRADIPCTTPVRTVLDLSGRLTDVDLGRFIDELLRRRLVDLEVLRSRARSLRPAPGYSPKRLERVLALRPPRYDPGESVLEARVLSIIASHGFPVPTQQLRVVACGRSYRLDFAYASERLYLEGDGFGYHSTASDLDDDARRRNHLVVEGWRPLTFTWRMTDAEIVAVLDGVYDRASASWRLCAR